MTLTVGGYVCEIERRNGFLYAHTLNGSGSAIELLELCQMVKFYSTNVETIYLAVDSDNPLFERLMNLYVKRYGAKEIARILEVV